MDPELTMDPATCQFWSIFDVFDRIRDLPTVLDLLVQRAITLAKEEKCDFGEILVRLESYLREGKYNTFIMSRCASTKPENVMTHAGYEPIDVDKIKVEDPITGKIKPRAIYFSTARNALEVRKGYSIESNEQNLKFLREDTGLEVIDKLPAQKRHITSK